MGWHIRIIADDKYQVYSTIVDDFITDVLNKKEVIKFITKDWDEDHHQRKEELKNNFPNGWINHDTGRLIREVKK